jgi:adenylosuccinate lyase
MDVEVVLAQTQAELGVIPESAADELARHGSLNQLDKEVILAKLQISGHSLMPLIFAWQQVVSESCGRYIHYGATTQDIQDTSQSLELKDVCSIIDRDYSAIVCKLMGLAGQYRDLVAVGRTHGQHALPTTMGLKFAVWLDEMLRNGERFQQCKERLLVCQMFGGVGTMAGFGAHGLAIMSGVAERLGLSKARVAWHASRDRVAEFIAVSAIMAGTLANIANEICQLSRDEIKEMEEPFHLGKVGSSTMPHKRNPELCEQVIVLARLIKSNTSLGFDGLINEHERDYRAVRMEWISVADTSMFLCKALDLIKNILTDLIVYREGVSKNVLSSAELISSESLMFLLGSKLGNQKAHTFIYETAMKAHQEGSSLIDLLRDIDLVNELFTRDELIRAAQPGNNIGLAAELTEIVIKAAEDQRGHGSAVQQHTSTCSLCGSRHLEGKAERG